MRGDIVPRSVTVKSRLGATLVALMSLLLLFLPGPRSSANAQTVHLLPYEGAITPVASEYIVQGIEAAEDAAVEAVIVRLDTPGGLDSSMREIIKATMASDVPVIFFVAPGGSRAASAGVYMTMAAHVAAMAPGTNIGSASPVAMMGAAMDSTMSKKVTNDAVAYLESIAQKRGRNAEWAKRFVVDAENIPAERAVEERVVDLVADDVPGLLDAIDGWTVDVDGESWTLATANATVDERPMSLRLAFLKRLVDPNVAYLLLLLGIYGLFFELSNPGALAPGILGGISILLALYALNSLPTNFAGIGLMVLGVIMLILEVKITSYGALSIGGLASLVLGSLMLFESPASWARVSMKVLIPALLGFSAFFLVCAWLVVRSQRRPVSTGMAALIGEHGRVLNAITPGEPGKVVFHGEVWDAVADEPVTSGASIEVVAIEGRIARVRHLATPEI